MTSSLVGSEMCIRDSFNWPPLPLQARRAPPVSVGDRAVPAPTQPRGEPVSYTHLTLPTICSV
eukprot:4512212-Prorocentrum_lima.AAC.1